MYQSYGAQSPDLTNNPFITDPSNAQSRFPDISSASSPDPYNTQYNAWMQSQGSAYGQGAMISPLHPGQTPSGFGQQFMSPGQMQMQSQPTGYTPPYQIPMQTGYLGQQMQQSAYPVQQQQYQTGYGQQQMPMQMQPQPQVIGYQDVAEFDPYGSISQGWGETQGRQSQRSQSQQSNTSSYNGHLHPREYIRTHKAELESWDSYAWKQCLNSFDVLKDAWTTRKKEVEGRIAIVKRDYGYTGQGEVERLQGIVKDADLKFDSVTASSFQMHEVFQGYRQSGDLASKRRVREATNAALTSLPPWPTPEF